MLRRDSDRILAGFLAGARGLRSATAVLADPIAAGYLDWVRERPAVRLTPTGTADFLLGWFPRYGLVAGRDVARVPVVLAALTRFLANRGRITAATRDRILATLALNREAFLRAARDPRRFSAAKLAVLGRVAAPRPLVAPVGRDSDPRVTA